jgi:hypothetical protein
MKKNMNMPYVPSIRRVRQKALNSSNHQNNHQNSHQQARHHHSQRHHNLDVVDWDYEIKRHRDRELDRELRDIERQREWEKEMAFGSRTRRSRPRYRRSSPSDK